MYSCGLIMLEGLFSLLFYCESGINQYAGQKTSIDVLGRVCYHLGWVDLDTLGYSKNKQTEGGGERGVEETLF